MSEPTEQEFGFDFSNQKAGIVQCLLKVRAPDQIQAVCKALKHITDMNRGFSRKPTKTPKNVKELWDELALRLNNCTDPITFVLTVHMFTEFWLNHILWRFCPEADLSRWDFFKKLELCYAIGKLPKPLLMNLQKLNDLRVKAAHDLNFDVTTMDLGYVTFKNGFDISKYQPSYDLKTDQHHWSNVLGVVMSATYFELHRHCTEVLKLGRGEDGKMVDFPTPPKPLRK